MSNYFQPIVLLLLLMVAACNMGPVEQPAPTSTAVLFDMSPETSQATATEAPTATEITLPTETAAPTASPAPPTITPSPEPTATTPQTHGLGIDSQTIQTAYEEMGMEFMPTEVDGIPALQGTDSLFPEVHVDLIGSPNDLESVVLYIFFFDSEMLYVLLADYSSPIFTGRGTPDERIEDYYNTINDESVDAINQEISEGQITFDDLVVFYEVSGDEIAYTFKPVE